jgi:type IV pilus assembly protein PilY1
MKPESRNRATPGFALLSAALFAAGLALPAPALAQTVEIATSPMATSTTTTVKPNLMFVLDDSGSMDWDYLPSEANDFSDNDYGFNSSQCNGNYYNPAITYDPAVNATGGPLNATPTTFTAAYRDGFNTGLGTRNLSNDFRGGSGSGASGISLTPGPAFYYVYTGSQTSAAQKDYFNTGSTFYQECNSNIGSAPGSGVFTARRLSTISSTTLTVAGASGGTTLKFRVTNASSTDPRVTQIELNPSGGGGIDIMTGSTSTNNNVTNEVLASRIAGKINECTAVATGDCNRTGYSAFVGTGADDNLVTVVWDGSGGNPGSNPAVSHLGMLVIILDEGSATFTLVQDWTTSGNATTVDSIMVGGTSILPTSASGTTPSALAADIQAKISATGYSATVSGAVVTVTGPTSASNLTPVIATSGTAPLMTVTALPFPESDPAQLQNFANWYSYYSNRMLMMKTGAGLAFQNVTDKYRVGFLTMNNNVSPGILGVDTFTGTQKTNWYAKLYAANPGDSTPLREILSRTGQYYAHLFGSVTKYRATITVGGGTAAETAVDSITVNGVELMNDSTVPSTDSNTVAQRVANQINAKEVTDFGATVSGNVITITGPAAANSFLPIITTSGGSKTFAPTSFSGTTTTAQLNGITPADPLQYSCQQNFTILSTDGYWNGPNTYNLANSAVGQQDGAGVPRPLNDGGQSTTTYTNTYTRTSYSRAGSSGPCSGWTRPQTETPQIGTCTTTTSGGSCTPSNWTSNGATINSPTYPVCINSGSIPPATAAVLQGTVTTAGSTGGVSNTLADVAMYYYQTDLRTPALGNCTGVLGTSVCENNVFVSGADNNLQQHMTTFTLGLGVRGQMVYSPSYLTDTTGDFVAVKLGSTATGGVCPWQSNNGQPCNWPAPVSGQETTTDDLWHAAVNGRGAYFSATDPSSLANGLSNALTSINSKEGAAAAAATSTLNPVAGNNFAYVASYTTLKWTGNLEARGIDINTGVISENATWCLENVSASACAAPGTLVTDTSGGTNALYCVTPDAVTCVGGELVGTDCRVPVAAACTGTMNARVTDSTDTRLIKTANSTGAALIDFDAAYAAANPSLFSATVLAGLSQWPPASDTSAAADYFRANAIGTNLVNYLRGRKGNEIGSGTVAAIDQFYRAREAVIGDALESQPAFIGAPVFSYPYPGYTEFLAAQASRIGSVYMGTNDGMMHSFNSVDGAERWAYVPSMVIPDLWRLADNLYKDKHSNYVNGSPITTDVCTANCSNPHNATTVAAGTQPVWKTILIAGLNGGGRGYFALDITDPVTPTLLWEFTTTAGIGKVKDNDLGYTFGQPVVTRKADGTWVVLVTSGYDNGTDSPFKSAGSFIPNAPGGSGIGYLYVLDAATGTIISKISTGTGSAAAPSGLAKIAGFNAEPGGNKANYVYGGDLLGNLWRFDINDAATTAAIGTGSAFKLATLLGPTSVAQPITTTPILGTIAGKRIVYVGTGKYLEVPDLSTTPIQTQYAIKDDDATATLVNARTALVQQFLIPNPDGTATRLAGASAGATSPGTNTVDFSIQRGWFVDFPESRERVNIDARLVLGTLVVPTIVPSSTECSPGGSGWLNFFDYRTGGAVNPLTGLTSVKYDSTIVGVNVLFIEGKPIVEVVTSTNPTPEKDPNVEFAAAAAGFAGKRVLWRELIPQD